MNFVKIGMPQGGMIYVNLAQVESVTINGGICALKTALGVQWVTADVEEVAAIMMKLEGI